MDIDPKLQVSKGLAETPTSQGLELYALALTGSQEVRGSIPLRPTFFSVSYGSSTGVEWGLVL